MVLYLVPIILIKKSIVTSADGGNVSINQSQLLSALTINITDSTSPSLGSALYSTAGNGTASGSKLANIYTFAASSTDDAISLGAIDAGVYTKALENIATLRSENGASVSAYVRGGSCFPEKDQSGSCTWSHYGCGHSFESTALAKYSILVQASASMLAQANQSANIALHF